MTSIERGNLDQETDTCRGWTEKTQGELHAIGEPGDGSVSQGMPAEGWQPPPAAGRGEEGFSSPGFRVMALHTS